ncbi:hypothetical protein PEPS_38210 (plasmid) [Persicobacter psychrovividus]|uniref:Uncharacterized protein n=1 Tax=Persicobacter psychrovividus TaxID=387638 RepID=A0ABN6LED8_9BACT|nr:hypothetical protein PEPS_38210 [Persicobacter psychrovividus]
MLVKEEISGSYWGYQIWGLAGCLHFGGLSLMPSITYNFIEPIKLWIDYYTVGKHRFADGKITVIRMQKYGSSNLPQLNRGYHLLPNRPFHSSFSAQ